MNHYLHFEYPHHGHEWDIIVPLTAQQYTLLSADGPDPDGQHEDLLEDLFNEQQETNPVPAKGDLVLKCPGLSEPF